ncbi:protein MIS12 homolog [Typha angustifolia]|uniref:protein MIS12 homolog n=1 Tax=Typha angustifolia TaxID=59011 RepID=UPI003C2DD5B7
MEGSESEAAFDALGLNPQLFLNEVLNTVDDMVDGAFGFCLQQAPEIAGGGCSDKAEELAKGVHSLRHLVKAVLDRRMDSWEKYCLRHCFTVPEGFVLPKADDSSAENLLVEGGLSDGELDSQLDSLRDKLAALGKESAELQREITLLEKQSKFSSSYDTSVAETLQLFDENSVQEMFQDIGKTMSKLHQKMSEMENKRRQNMDHHRVQNIYDSSKERHDKGFSSKLEDVEDILNIMRKM